MRDLLVASLSGEETVHTCSLATVTTSCVVIRTASARSRAIVSLYSITGMTTVKTAYPAFLAIAAGLFLLAAGAHFSKDGGSADLPMAVLGFVSVISFLVSRKAAVLFCMGRESLQTVNGGLREAAHLIRAVRSAQEAVEETPAGEAIAS
jgi:hypothetical protein